MDARTIVDEIRQRTPCPMSWDEMKGDDRVRFCAACSRSVYNIMAMTTEEAAVLFTKREGRLCLRLYRRPDGTVVTADCPPVPATPAPQRRPLRRVHALVIVLLALMLTWARRDTSPPPPSGPGVAWDDWVQWAAVSLGIRHAPLAAPVFTPIPQGEVITGDAF